jgi:hypothetical protein
LGRSVTRTSGRYVHPFFVTSKLKPVSAPPATHKHLLDVRNATTVPHLGELTSLTGNGDTTYLVAQPDHQKWVVGFTCMGTAPALLGCDLSVSAGATPVVQTISLKAKRQSWTDWDDCMIQPVLEVTG